jgi:hypothetical protein
MPYLRYYIGGILWAILIVAFGFAALREADDLWGSGLFSLTLGLLLAAVLLAVHRTGARRAFWLGFALFGWGYLSLSLVPSIEFRLITAQALAYLEQTNIFGNRAYAMRALLDPDRMRAYNLSTADVMKAVKEQSTIGSPGRLREAERPTSQRAPYVLTWEGRGRTPEQSGNIVLKANPDGETLRLKDVGTVGLGSSFSIPGVAAGTTENFICIGHSLFTLLAAQLGGVLSLWLGRYTIRFSS